MTKITPRDSLGRIVYEGDTIYIEGFRNSDTTAGANAMALFECRAIKSEIFTVDLEVSPPHTNHERYFADLGTLEEVLRASDDAFVCEYYPCYACPFNNWGVLFYPEAYWPNDNGCWTFDEWLGEQAVI